MKLFVFICLIGLALRGAAQTPSDSSVAMRFRIYYPVGKSQLREDYMENAKTLQHIQKYLEHSSQIDSITIYSYASPEGPYQLNKRLATNRGKTIKNYLLKHLPAHRTLSDQFIIIDPTAENWSGLRDLVYYQYPHANRDEVLAVLDRTDIGDEQRKALLKRLDGGKSWKYLLKHLMPQLRYATWVTVWQRLEIDKPLESTASLKMDFPAMSLPMLEPVPVAAPVKTKVEGQFPWALKTNLLYDAVLSPSIEVEYRFAPHWSAHADFAIAWWSKKKEHKYYQIAQLSPEIRYWFNDKKFWKGHYIGAFVGAGHYDLENGKDGYKGEFMMTGLSYGYMFPIGKYLSIDAGIGVGYLHTEYEEYLPIEGHYVYQQTSRTTYVGPVKARLSLVWQTDWKWLKGGLR